MGYFSDYSDETPEERRMRLLAEMGSPYLNPSPGADMGVTPVGPAGMMPQGGLMAFGPSVGGNENRPELAMGAPWVDPGQTPGGTGRDYTEPPPRLGNLFRKPGEPQAPEQDGILFNGTRSAPGRDILSSETPTAAIPSGPIASPSDINVQGANNQDRTNAPRSPDMPKTAAMGLPSFAGGLGIGPAAAYASSPRVGAGLAAASPPASAPTAGDGEEAPAKPSSPAGQPALSQPQAAAIADGLSRKPGSPAAMNWLAENADLLIGLGAGLLSGKNIGEGIIAGLKMANESKSTSAKAKAEAEKNQAENLKKASAAALLQKAFGMPSDMAIASADNADLVRRAGQIVYPDPTSPDWVREKDANGTDVLRNTKTGDLKAAPKAEKEEAPARPLTPAEKAQWGIPADDTRPYALTPGKAPTLIGGQQPFETPAQAAQKAEATARVSAGTDQATKLASNRLQAQTNMSLARQTEQLLNAVEPGAVTGATAQLREKFGLNIDQNGGKVQALQAALERLANDQHKVGTGAVSDADLRSFQKQVPSLFGTKEGNQLIMDTIKGVAEYNDKATELAAQWRGNKISLDQFNDRIEQLPNPMDNFQRYQAQRNQAAQAAAPAASPAEASRGARVPMYDPKTRTFR